MTKGKYGHILDQREGHMVSNGTVFVLKLNNNNLGFLSPELYDMNADVVCCSRSDSVPFYFPTYIISTINLAHMSKITVCDDK